MWLHTFSAFSVSQISNSIINFLNFWGTLMNKNFQGSWISNQKKIGAQISRKITKDEPATEKLSIIKLRMQIVYTNFSFFLFSRTRHQHGSTPPMSTSPKPFHLINLICYDPRKAYFMNNYCTLNKNALFCFFFAIFYFFLLLLQKIFSFFFLSLLKLGGKIEKLTSVVDLIRRLDGATEAVESSVGLIINSFSLFPPPILPLVFHLTRFQLISLSLVGKGKAVLCVLITFSSFIFARAQWSSHPLEWAWDCEFHFPSFSLPHSLFIPSCSYIFWRNEIETNGTWKRSSKIKIRIQSIRRVVMRRQGAEQRDFLFLIGWTRG